MIPSFEDAIKQFQSNKLDNIEQDLDFETRNIDKFFQVINLKSKKIKYYFLTNIYLGQGDYGTIHDGLDLETKSRVIFKHTPIGDNEITALRRVGMYLGHCKSYIIMKYIKGTELGSFLNGSIDVDFIIKIMPIIKEKIDELRIFGIVHQDLHPMNILIDVNETITVTIIDFGSSSIQPIGIHDGLFWSDISELIRHLLEFTPLKYNKKFRDYVLPMMNIDNNNKNKSNSESIIDVDLHVDEHHVDMKKNTNKKFLWILPAIAVVAISFFVLLKKKIN